MARCPGWLPLQRAHDAEAADPFRHLQPPFPQLGRNQGGGTVFVHADLRMGVDVPPDRDQLWLQRGNAVE